MYAWLFVFTQKRGEGDHEHKIGLFMVVVTVVEIY